MKLDKLCALIDQHVRCNGAPLDVILNDVEVFHLYTPSCNPRVFCFIQYVGSTFIYTAITQDVTTHYGIFYIYDLKEWVKSRRRSIQRSLFSPAPQAEAYAAFRRLFAPDSQPCAICGAPVYWDFQQEFTKHRFGKVLCFDCEALNLIFKDCAGCMACTIDVDCAGCSNICSSCSQYKNGCLGCRIGQAPKPKDGGQE